MNPDSPTRKRPQKLKERLREVTSSAILAAAEEVLLERGLQASMEIIAARAGVAVGTLYNHFADRKTLVDALIAGHRATLQADVRAAEKASMDLPVREQLLAMLTAMLSAWSRIFLVIKQGEHFPDMKSRAQLRSRILELFGPVLERGRKQGTIAADPEGLQHIALTGLLQAHFGFSIDDPKKLPPQRAVELVVDFFLQGVAKQRNPKS